MGIASVLINLGDVAIEQGDYTTARSMFEESLAINRELGDKWRIAVVLNGLGRVAYVQRDYTTARSMFEEGLVIRKELGDRGGIALMLNNLGALAHAEGDYDVEHSLLKESLGIYGEIGENLGITVCLAGLGGLAVGRVIGTAGVNQEEQVEQVERGARLLGAVEGLLQRMGFVLDRFDRESYEESIKQARVQLGEGAFEKAWEEGLTMSMEEAITAALEAHTPK
jgi:tetratricopeptide (TPR) repeat protein